MAASNSDMLSLQDANIFQIKPLITNLNCKLSAVTDFDPKKQILCLISEENDIVLRFTDSLGAEVLKCVSWFRKTSRVIHDVCFDPSGTWLLVLCYDNTLHIVPALSIVDKSIQLANSTFSTTQITSYVIPFVGPHECPNSKECPNNFQNVTESSFTVASLDATTKNDLVEFDFNQLVNNSVIVNSSNSAELELEQKENVEKTTTENILETDCNPVVEQNDANDPLFESFMSSPTCPFPLSAVWWQSLDQRNRAAIGYSDGSICFVGLSPNCPFIANTSIEGGSVVKLLVCKDSSSDNVSLLITSSTKKQFKLLLEQKSIKYTYPGDMSPTSSDHHDDWQILLPIKSNSNCSDPASDSSQIDEEVFIKSDDSKHVPTQPFSQEIDDINSRIGILPAARARLASLKSLGSKKLNAIKMRLSDNRHKLEEYMSENSLNNFAILDSPALTPEAISSSAGPFFIIQHLRQMYLLSALHTASETLSVHRMDISLIPMFLYKLPSNCHEVLISSNILYAIQYVNIKSVESKQSESLQEHKSNNETKDTEEEDKKLEAKDIVDKNEIMDKESEAHPSDGTNAIDNSDEENKENLDHEHDYKNVEDSAKIEDNIKIENTNMVNCVSVMSSAMAMMRTGEDISFNNKSLLAQFPFEEETVLNVYQMANYSTGDPNIVAKDEQDLPCPKEVLSPAEYVQFFRNLQSDECFSLKDAEVMRVEFPKVNYDPSFVITNRNVYYIQLCKEPFAIFLEAALAGQWNQCEEFCNTFDLPFAQCIEFVGDYLLRRKKVTQALLTYNMARIPPMRTALKLAMFGETYALMHLCAMALKCTYLLRSTYFSNTVINALLNGVTYRHAEDVRHVLPKCAPKNVVVNEGEKCSNYDYIHDESISSLQMTASSQFHLSNLLLITLAEKAVKDKNYIPLWNFLVTNTKYHTNMTSIVLCQSGLYSAAVLLGWTRGACMDAFIGLTSVATQEFGWYSELNVCLYNLSENIFTECITNLHRISFDYFMLIQDKLSHIFDCVLERLESQLNPFSPILRPIISHSSSSRSGELSNDNKSQIFDFCKNLIETYLAVIIHMESLRSKKDNIVNALTTFQLTYEDNQFAMDSSRFPPFSAGFSHCSCVVDGVAYFWGSSGVPCIYSVIKCPDPPEPPHAVKCLDILSQLNLEVHAVKCGRQHSLILTNNGIYAFGNNNLGQLGIGRNMEAALHPMLITALDGKNISILEAGQYHNAAVADGHLYTWGWGVYGQLGNISTENVSEPILVPFFKYKKIAQVSLGHAHSLVLCRDRHGFTELYTFGSNHFGQLGVGAIPSTKVNEKIQKSLVPLKLEFRTKIRLIHTKFFSNLVVDENNILYTWGSSPQALRLANQIKRRANTKQKMEESLRREINKRLETTQDSQVAESVTIEVPKTVIKRSISDPTNEASSQLSSSDCKPQAVTSTETIEVSKPIYEDASSMTTSTKDIEMKEIVHVQPQPPPPPEESTRIISGNDATATGTATASSSLENKPVLNDSEATDHLVPQKIDTSEVSGQIVQISSGLFHFALISSTSLLYTWGKNLEHQLGTEDKERKSVNKPAALENIENPLFVDCGADFTIVMTTDFLVKAFGGNANGQCGRDIIPSNDKNKPGRVICLPTTKRLMRLEGQCVEAPYEINLPRPRINLDQEPTRYFKSVPNYQPHFLQAACFSFNMSSNQSSDDQCVCQATEDLASSLENLSISLREGDSFDNITPPTRQESSNDMSPEEQSYCRLPASGDSLIDNDSSDDSDECTNEFRNYIHYCLYFFHGLYSTDKVRNFSKNRLEYHVRTMMLNFKFIDAFCLCLNECQTALKSLKIFEFFTKDTSTVPMRREDLRFFIFRLFEHFITHKFDMSECEKFFLSDLDYYLLELSYVLYFNNNNNELERTLNEKFKSLFTQHCNQNDGHILQDTDGIFDSLSVKFKTIICQSLLLRIDK